MSFWTRFTQTAAAADSLHGTDTMVKYIRLLARFGEYSGVGIRTAIGMGGMRLKDTDKDLTDTGRHAS